MLDLSRCPASINAVHYRLVAGATGRPFFSAIDNTDSSSSVLHSQRGPLHCSNSMAVADAIPPEFHW